MKVYLIYQNPVLRHPSFKSKDDSEWELYAVTNDKSLYKGFVDTRDMKYYKVEKTQVTKERYQKLAFDYRESILQMSTFSTSKGYPKTLMGTYGKNIMDVSIVTTYLEYQSVQESVDNPYVMLENDKLINPLLFSKRMRKLLNLIRYDQIYKMLLLPNLGIDSFMIESKEYLEDTDLDELDKQFILESDDITIPDLWVDELMIFIKLYGNQLRIKNKK